MPGIRHWTIHDERIDFRSESYAVEVDGRWVLIDPLPLAETALERFGPVAAIWLTGGFHQRAAWRLRQRFRVPVHVPIGAQGLDERPDWEYTDGARIGKGLVALHRPGPTAPHYVFLLEREGGRAALFCADLLMRAGDGPFAFVPDEHQDDPAGTRESVRRLLELDVDLLCPAHGEPALEDGTEAMRKALERDEAVRSGER